MLLSFILVCKQALVWSLAREQRNRESERQNHESSRLVRSPVRWFRGSLSRFRRSRTRPQKRACSRASYSSAETFFSVILKVFYLQSSAVSRLDGWKLPLFCMSSQFSQGVSIQQPPNRLALIGSAENSVVHEVPLV